MVRKRRSPVLAALAVALGDTLVRYVRRALVLHLLDLETAENERRIALEMQASATAR